MEYRFCQTSSGRLPPGGNIDVRRCVIGMRSCERKSMACGPQVCTNSLTYMLLESMSYCLTRLRLLGVNLLSRIAIGVVRPIVRWATDVVAEFLAPRQLPLSHVRSVRICITS